MIDYLELGLGGNRYQIAVKDLTHTATYEDGGWLFTDYREDCDFFITPLKGDEKTIRLGDPFFVSFVPIFDVDNDRLGLAMNVNAPERSSITPVEADEKTLNIEQ